MKLSIVVPCYNESENIKNFYETVNRIVYQMKIKAEIIFVNDGSSDDTEEILKKLNADTDNVSYISFTRNFGKEAAMLAGLRNVSDDSSFVAIMDADLQDPPALMKDMLAELMDHKEIDCVAAKRIDRKGESVIRSFFSRLFYKLVNRVSEVEIPDGARDFRIMKKEMSDAIASLPEISRFSKGLFSWVGYNTKWISYENIERKRGQSRWPFFKLFAYAIDGIISFSTFPLTIVSGMGIITCISAFLLTIYMIAQKLLIGIDIEGYALMICVILFLGGIQLSCIGIVGIYISKIFKETKHRPEYIIKNVSLKRS